LKKIIKISLITVIVFTLLACSKSNSELKLGIYVTNDELASLTLGEDNTFLLNRQITTSHNPNGNYKIEGNILLLNFDKDETQKIKFRIRGNILIFESEELAETLIKKGSEFIFQEED